MPLRLARFGVPLAETAPAGLAAAGIEELPIVFTVERAPASVRPDNSTLDATAEHEPAAAELDSAELQPVRAPVSASMPERPHDPQESAEESAERFAEAYRSFIAEFQVEPSAVQWALWLRDTYGISTGSGGPLSKDQAQPLLQVLKARYALHREEPAESDAQEPADQSWYDYFHSAWRTFAQEHGSYPDSVALAAYVYERDSITGDGGRPITGNDLAVFVATFQEREFSHGEPSADESATDPGEQAGEEALPQETEPEEAPVGAGAQAAKEKRTPGVSAAIDGPPPGAEEPAGSGRSSPRSIATTWRGGSTRASTARSRRLSNCPPISHRRA